MCNKSHVWYQFNCTYSAFQSKRNKKHVVQCIIFRLSCKKSGNVWSNCWLLSGFRLFRPDFMERRISTKTPSTITASSTISRRPTRHPAPHRHCLLVSAPFHRFSRIVHVLRSFSSAAIAGLSRARLLATDKKTHGHIWHFIRISFMFD